MQKKHKRQIFVLTLLSNTYNVAYFCRFIILVNRRSLYIHLYSPLMVENEINKHTYKEVSK